MAHILNDRLPSWIYGGSIWFSVWQMCVNSDTSKGAGLSAHSRNAKRMKKSRNSASQRHTLENQLPTQEQSQVACTGAYSGARSNL